MTDSLSPLGYYRWSKVDRNWSVSAYLVVLSSVFAGLPVAFAFHIAWWQTTLAVIGIGVVLSYPFWAYSMMSRRWQQEDDEKRRARRERQLREDGWGTVGFFPEDRYRIVKTDGGWDVLSNQEESFT